MLVTQGLLPSTVLSFAEVHYCTKTRRQLAFTYCLTNPRYPATFVFKILFTLYNDDFFEIDCYLLITRFRGLVNNLMHFLKKWHAHFEITGRLLLCRYHCLCRLGYALFTKPLAQVRFSPISVNKSIVSFFFFYFFQPSFSKLKVQHLN